MKIVVDANLFASALIKPNSNPGRILDLIKQNQVELILSPAIIKEIKRILLYPKLQKYHRKTAQEIDAYFEDILIFAWIVEGEGAIDLIEDDPTDNKYLACAYEGEADYIVSGDHHLLDLEVYEGIEILTAKSFLDIWEKERKPEDLSKI
ncbi:MAG: putative toxin-antitoxin system toxin component, PIN family [Deltaproteobacteria bacterium]|nr:putative toxin-antitoxin system toxin component, PIN family [Deltaproteobacteria bacterium]MDL1962287.1 putative toxin-antitoxin system toxin component, PIN family [Deltaproteobacteria bacterium]